MKNTTLVLAFRSKEFEEILLGYKKAGFGAGKYTGFGGKVQFRETITEAAVREFTEETGILLNISCLQKVAILDFHFPYKHEWDQTVHVFITRDLKMEAIESTEMIPSWFPVADIPYKQMWDDARYWLPQILKGDTFRANFYFQPDNSLVANLYFNPLFS